MNQNGEINVEDVTTVVDNVVKNMAPEQTQQYVTAEDLSILFNNVLQELSDIKKRLNYVMEKSGISNPFEPDENGIITYGHEYVDLGIVVDGKPVYWATTNIGADNAWDSGDFFAWGETKAYGEEDTSNTQLFQTNGSYTKTYYNWSTYKWCSGSYNTMTKYCTDSYYGTVDNNTFLDAEDDAAYINWEGVWRMPSEKELTLLTKECYWQWEGDYRGSGSFGYIVFKAKSSSDKGKCKTINSTPSLSSSYSLDDPHIFLPIAGTCEPTYQEGQCGYWSLTEYGNSQAYELDFGPMGRGVQSFDRYIGLSIRPVCQ